MKYISLLSTIILITASILLTTAGCYRHEQKPAKKYSRDMINRGEQLVSEGRCSFCHTPSIDSDEGSIPDPERLLSGHPAETGVPELPDVPAGSQQWLEFLNNLESTVWAGPWGITFAANLTPDKETGIGNWTATNFVNTMKTGKHAGFGRDILPPMPWDDYRQLSDEDLEAIFAYLQTIEPVKNEVPEPVLPDEIK